MTAVRDGFSPEELSVCLEVLEALAERRALLASVDEVVRRRLLVAAGRLSRPERAEQRELAKAFRRMDRERHKASDGALLDATGIRAARGMPAFQTPEPLALPSSEPRLTDAGPANAEPRSTWNEPANAGPGSSAEHFAASGPELARPRKCYVCKTEYRTVHFFYDSMCTACGDFNYRKRLQTASLTGRVVLISGARVKIGYQAAIKLLRAGARVVITTRFPRDAAKRYAEERDFDAWGARLSIYGLDLRHTPSVELFARTMDRALARLDVIINNACQTVRRPPGFYAHLVEAESAPLSALPARARPLIAEYEALRQHGGLLLSSEDAHAPCAGLLEPALLSQIRTAADRLSACAEAPRSQVPPSPDDALFPRGRYDADRQQVDLRDMNSWRLTLGEVPTVEMLEVQLVNAVAPFVLNAQLKPLMLRDRTFDKHIVNVSAMEGQFYREYKTDKHPHTNMAKAALNMMTRTSAADYAKDGIFMNSVDTGWVTDEDPAALSARKVEEHGFHPPLDIVDGAARICDPIFSAVITGERISGQFLKDYVPTAW